MQTRDAVQGLHNCLQFWQFPPVFRWGYGDRENVLYCLIRSFTRNKLHIKNTHNRTLLEVRELLHIAASIDFTVERKEKTRKKCSHQAQVFRQLEREVLRTKIKESARYANIFHTSNLFQRVSIVFVLTASLSSWIFDISEMTYCLFFVAITVRRMTILLRRRKRKHSKCSQSPRFDAGTGTNQICHRNNSAAKWRQFKSAFDWPYSGIRIRGVMI